MKKQLQVLVCAAIFAVAGLNFYTAFDNGVSSTELKVEDAEMLAEGEGWFYNLFHPKHLEYVHVEYLYSFWQLDDHWERLDCKLVEGRGSDKCAEGNTKLVQILN